MYFYEDTHPKHTHEHTHKPPPTRTLSFPRLKLNSKYLKPRNPSVICYEVKRGGP